MITGAFNFLAVSNTPFILLDPITLTAGNANCFSLAILKISCTWSPVATPGLILFLIKYSYVFRFVYINFSQCKVMNNK